MSEQAGDGAPTDDWPQEMWLQRLHHVLRPEQFSVPDYDRGNIYIDVAEGFGRHFIRAATGPAEPSDEAVIAAAKKMWIDPGKLDREATREGLRAAYAVDFGRASPPREGATDG
jgi:hypothetical protein